MIAPWLGVTPGAASIHQALAYQLQPPDWHQDAACRGLSPAESDALFFFDGHPPSTRARNLCAGCPVQQQCLEAAEPVGMWGGTTPTERAGAVA